MNEFFQILNIHNPKILLIQPLQTHQDHLSYWPQLIYMAKMLAAQLAQITQLRSRDAYIANMA